MFKKNTSVTYLPIGAFISAADGSAVTTGTPSGTYSADGTGGTLSGAIAYNATAGEWGITGLTSGEMDGDVIGLTFALTGCLPIHYTIRTATKLVSDLNDAATVTTPTNFASLSIDGSGRMLLQPTQTGVTIPTVTTLTGNVDGNVTGSVGSVLGAVGGAVASVTATVTATLAATQPNYAPAKAGDAMNLVSAYDAAKTAAPTAAAISTQIASDLATAHGAGSWTTADLSALASGAAIQAVADTIGAAGAGLTAIPYTGPTAAAIADAVWDEAQSGHTTAGTFGVYLDASVSGVSTGGVSADDIATAVWAATTRSITDKAGFSLAVAPPTASTIASVVLAATATGAAGSVGSVLISTLNAVGNVKAKTDNLPASPAAVGSAMTLAAGSIASATFAAGATVPRVTLVDTCTANTDMRGTDSAATASNLAAVKADTAAILLDTGTDGVKLALSQAGLAPRALDSVADAALTVGDALTAAICAAAGKESVVGTAYTVKTPSTGTVVRTFALDNATTPTARD